MILKTSSWFQPLPPDHLRVGISRGVPRRFPAGYRRYTKLNPGPWFNSVSAEEYIRLYAAEILAPLDPQQVVDELHAIAGGRVPVLCCWERVGCGSWCHRALVAEWFERTLGLAVPEVGFESLALDLHPLLPQGSLL
jgi:hypothetical protein